MISFVTIRIQIGTEIRVFTQGDIIDATLIESVPVTATELPVSTFEFRIHTTEEEFSMFGGSYFESLSRRAPIYLYETLQGVEMFLGKFYLDEWENIDENTFSFKAVDLVGALDKLDFDGRFYETPVSLSSVVDELFSSRGFIIQIDTTLSSNTISGWIPPSTLREALQKVLFASRATIYTTRVQVPIIKPVRVPQGLFDYRVPPSQKLKDQKVTYSAPVSSIELISHNYTKGTELVTIFDEDLPAGSHKIVFNEPYYELVVDGVGYIPYVITTEDEEYFLATEDENYFFEIGGEYQFGPNCIYFEMANSGHVTISGYQWVDSKRAFLYSEPILQEEEMNSIKVDNVQLVNLSNAGAILDTMKETGKLLYQQEVTFLPEVGVKAGDHIINSAFSGAKFLGQVIQLETELTKGFLLKAKLSGVSPSYVPPLEVAKLRARTGIAICGSDLIRQNFFRRYDG